MNISEARKRKRERIIMTVAAFLVALLSLAEYFLISGKGPFPLGSNILIFSIINLNILLILLLIFLIVRNLVKLIFEDKRNILGAKLRTKLVIAFVSLSLLPTLALFFVSLQFLNTSLNYWFDAKVELSLEDAILIGRTFYQERISQLQNAAQYAGRSISLKCISDSSHIDTVCIGQWAGISSSVSGPANLSVGIPIHSIEIINFRNEELFVKTWLPLVGDPPALSPSLIDQVFDGKESLIDSVSLENGELVRILRPLRGSDSRIVAVLAIGNLIPQNIGHLLDEIRAGYEDYRQLRLFQNPIKVTVLINLFLITLLILFVSIWLGFRLAKGITEPVQMLADATHRIAQGDLDFSLEVHGKDELSSLVKAFNTMTQDLKEARKRAENASSQLMLSYEELERRQRYIEIILQNVAAGVISINRYGIITTVNRSAENILGIAAEEVIGKPYKDILTGEQAEEFEIIRKDLNSSSRGTLQRAMRLDVGDRVLSLLVSFTLLKDPEERIHGVVVVFDDLTELEKIQRLAAWREVARRIAHEVKNPLTPIQLSAQRLRKKYMNALDDESKGVFDRCTNTIISQVEELKRLVNEFSNFARMPALRPRLTDLGELMEEVLIMYREAHPQIEFTLDVAKDLPKIMVDPDQIKRAVVNLLDNAVASLGEGGEVSVTLFHDASKDEVYLEVADTGVGIAPEDKPRLFEPYFSRRKGGTGLGLAIVNSIVSDHGGRIVLEENIPRGAKFVIVLPVTEE